MYTFFVIMYGMLLLWGFIILAIAIRMRIRYNRDQRIEDTEEEESENSENYRVDEPSYDNFVSSVYPLRSMDNDDDNANRIFDDPMLRIQNYSDRMNRLNQDSLSSLMEVKKQNLNSSSPRPSFYQIASMNDELPVNAHRRVGSGRIYRDRIRAKTSRQM
jgi:hypothetical protein